VRALRLLAVAVAVQAALLGCTDSSDQPAAGSPAPSSTPAPAPPTPAGTAEAHALAALPTGPATGTAVVAVTGAGELRAPFTGQCSHTADGTRLEGSADTATIRLDVTPGGAHLALDDVGLSATSDVATGRYEVSGRHLSLSAALVHDGGSTGSVELEVDCGG
jgi:hypothetical protein